MKGSIAILLVVVVAFLAGWAQAADESDDPRLELLRNLNDWRMSANLREVFVNEKLMDFAQRRVDEMASKSQITLDSESGKTVRDELVEAGYQVTRWTLDVVQGAKGPKLAMSHMVNQNSTAHLLDHFVREAGVGYSEEGGRWAVMLARRKAECGNGLVEMEEECDDGNTDDEDCCSSVCTIELECECEQAYDSPVSVCYV